MNSEIQPNLFVDTNIFVDYLIAAKVLNKLEKGSKLYNKLKCCFDFLEKYFQNYSKIRLCTSFLNLCELPCVLVENIISGRMKQNSIPFNLYEKYKKDFMKSKSYRNEIEEEISNYYEFLTIKKLWFIQGILITTDKELKEIDELRIEFNLQLADALIFYMAQKEGGFFITQDSDFLENKRLQEKYKTKIKIISPAQALEVVNDQLRLRIKNSQA